MREESQSKSNWQIDNQLLQDSRFLHSVQENEAQGGREIWCKHRKILSYDKGAVAVLWLAAGGVYETLETADGDAVGARSRVR